MPYCVVTAATAVAGGAHAQEEADEVRIFYQRYGHGATKVLLIIGTAQLAHFPSLFFFFVSAIFLLFVSFLVPDSRAPCHRQAKRDRATLSKISTPIGMQGSQGRTSRGARR